MNQTRTTKTIAALFALVLVFAMGGCKSESSPTAPTSGTGGTGSGGTSTTGGNNPPTNATVTLTVSSNNPLVNSSSVITATVTVGNSPAPDGTAVEFLTNFGKFVETSTADVDSKIAIRTTVGGKTTITLTAGEAGTAAVTATVNNVTKATVITFREEPIITPPASTAPAISSVSPTLISPAGGQLLTINGVNFREPITVFLDPGTGASPIQLQKVSSTDTTITVVTPKINLTAGQQQKFGIIVITSQGSASEARATLANAVTYQLDVLTPTIYSMSPASGPIDGGTRTTIFGTGFQEPMQVFFGTSEVKTVNVTFDEIIVISPPARDAGVTTGAVDVRIINPKTGKSTSLAGAFTYRQKMQITAISPTVGSALGGTRVRIDGIGFNDPLTVSIGGIAAQVVTVLGSQIIAITSPTATPCGSAGGAVVVTNIDNGDFATSLSTFSYIPVKPAVVSISPTAVQPGGSFSVVVSDPGIGQLGAANIQFGVGSKNVIPSPNVITTGTGNQTFNLIAPLTGFTFPTQACTTSGGLAGTNLAPVDVTLTFTNVTTGCTASIENGLTVNPPGTNACLTPPSPTVTSPAGGSCATPATASITGVGFPTQTTASIVISNAAGSQPLDITGASITGTDAADFQISPTTAAGIQAGASRTFTLTFHPTVAGAKSANVTFATNSSSAPTVSVCIQATAAP